MSDSAGGISLVDADEGTGFRVLLDASADQLVVVPHLVVQAARL